MTTPLVLCYHSVSPSWEEEVAVHPEQLEAQLQLLLRQGYRSRTFTSAVDQPEERTFSITFDDGFTDVLRHGLPVMRRLGVVGTIFVPTGFIGADGPLAWPGYDEMAGGSGRRHLQPLSWDQLGELVQEGWEVGSHTRSHPHLTRLPDDELQDELLRSRVEVEDALRTPCPAIAYPYGDVDHRVCRAAGVVGYRAGAGLARRLGAPHPLLVPRIGVYRCDTLRRFRVKVSRASTSRAGSASVLVAQRMRTHLRRLVPAD